MIPTLGIHTKVGGKETFEANFSKISSVGTCVVRDVGILHLARQVAGGLGRPLPDHILHQFVGAIELPLYTHEQIMDVYLNK